MLVATWNVNSIRQRLEHLVTILRDMAPDVVCLQELKCVDEVFPRSEIEAEGYQVETFGQKGFNGVALLSRRRLEDVRRGLPGEPDPAQSRYIEAVVSTGAGAVRVASLYLPNGNPVGTDKYPYKLAWMEALQRHAAELLRLEEPVILAGDYNVIPGPEDVYDPAGWSDDALYRAETRAAFRRLLHLGFTDGLRACDDRAGLYTFWDYKAGAYRQNLGLRIDHLLLSPQAADRLAAAFVHAAPRAWDKPSDHVPVVVDLAAD